mmetsp:Transcript_29849/g.33851  ORF Transcript_29849/g.33851 Transcript_29849/m.33851 type:complete len:92 (+) Transcript_29849:109-384(+)
MVLTLKEYRTMLLGANLEIYNNQKRTLIPEHFLWQVLRWRLCMEQPWKTKSRLGRNCGGFQLDMIGRQKGAVVDFKSLNVPSKDDDEKSNS